MSPHYKERAPAPSKGLDLIKPPKGTSMANAASARSLLSPHSSSLSWTDEKRSRLRNLRPIRSGTAESSLAMSTSLQLPPVASPSAFAPPSGVLRTESHVASDSGMILSATTNTDEMLAETCPVELSPLSNLRVAAIRDAIVQKYGSLHRWTQKKFHVAVRGGDHVIDEQEFREGLGRLGNVTLADEQTLIGMIRVADTGDVSVSRFFKVVTNGYDESVLKTKQVTVQACGGIRVIVPICAGDSERACVAATASRLAVKNAEDWHVVDGDGHPVAFEYSEVDEGSVYFFQRRPGRAHSPADTTAETAVTAEEYRSPARGLSASPPAASPPRRERFEFSTQTETADVLRIVDERVVYGERVVAYQQPQAVATTFVGTPGGTGRQSTFIKPSGGASGGTTNVFPQYHTPPASTSKATPKPAAAETPTSYGSPRPPPPPVLTSPAALVPAPLATPLPAAVVYPPPPQEVAAATEDAADPLSPTGGLYTALDHAVARRAQATPGGRPDPAGVREEFRNRLARERLRRGLPVGETGRGAAERLALEAEGEASELQPQSDALLLREHFYKQHEKRRALPSPSPHRLGDVSEGEAYPAQHASDIAEARRYVNTEAGTSSVYVMRQTPDDPFGARIVGTLVKGVAKRSAADKGGLKAGMMIHAVNGANVNSLDDIQV